jgi:hypothetical protein
VTLIAVPSAVSLARRLSAEVARHWHLPKSFVEDHEVIVAELTTNALKATLAFHEARGINTVGRIKLKLQWGNRSGVGRGGPSGLIEKPGGLCRIASGVVGEGGLQDVSGLAVLAFDEGGEADEPEPGPQVVDLIDSPRWLLVLFQVAPELGG